MASESEASCDEDPNFAVICAFFEKFGELLGVKDIDICELQTMLENTYEVSQSLMDLHVKLLRKIKKSVHPERWEKSLIKFSHTFSSKDAWEVERFGYKKSKLSSKVRILKELLEAQFDLNTKFKTEINKFGSSALRSQPLGRDKFGHAYWFQSDDNCHIRVFKEDLDDEKWTLVARDRTGLVSLITNLSDGDIKVSSDSAGNEDSNSLSEKPIIDTGQQDTDSKKTSDDEEDPNLERKNQDIEDKEKITPVLRIKNLIDLMPSPKRPRDEDDDEILQKYKIKNLEIRVSKIDEEEKEEPVVGEAIEEPVMRIEGQGSGEDNDSPIVGEPIEEDVFYVYGNGNGYDCQTGNQPEEEKQETSSAVDKRKSTEENIPKHSEESAAKGNESIQSNDSNLDSPKKFFFGSGSSPFKANSISSTTIAFGSPKKEKDNDENHVVNEKETSKTEKSNLDNKTVNINQPKASEEIPMESETKFKPNEITEPLEPKDNIQGSKKETDNVDISLKGSDDKTDKGESNSIVVEPLCVRKVAYICGKDDETDKDILVEKIDNVSMTSVEKVKNAETVNTDRIVNDKDAAKPPESVVTTETVKPTEIVKLAETDKSAETVKSAETTETDDAAPTLITAKIGVKDAENSSKPSEQTEENSNKEDLKKNDDEDSLDSNDLTIDEDPISKKASEEADQASDSGTEKPETKLDLSIPDTKANSDSNDNEVEVQPEVVFVSGRTRGKKQLVEAPAKSADKKVKAKKKVVKGRAVIKKKKANSLDNVKEEEKSKGNSADSSIPNSPAVSLGDNSVISMGEITAGESCDVEVPEADPLAVSDAEGDSKPAVPTTTISSFSLDFNDAPVKIPIVPSPMRAVRKRGREVPLKTTGAADNSPGKRMKLKGRRQVDTALRKSVEQRIEQLHGSSSESKDSEAEQQPISKKKVSRLKKSPTKKGRKQTASPEDSDPTPKKSPQIKRDPAKKNSRILAGLTIKEDSSSDRPVLRQSRRLAQLKIKEQVDLPVRSEVREEGYKKKSKNGNKIDKPEKRKRDKKAKEEDSSEPEVAIETKKKKKKEKPVSRMFNENRPWQSSSEDSEEVAEEEEEEEEIQEEDFVPLGDLRSDHEFSPESDVEDDDDYQPMKRARTAKKESDEDEADEFPCQKCGKEDHPEWILLCDKCDNGWHCSCLRPPLLVIPEGDWFCPPCQHIILLDQLQGKLAEYDKKLSKKEVEDRRKERLAYVGISLNNVLPSKEHADHRKNKRRHSASGSNSSSSQSESESESESDSDEPIYQLRQRRQTKNYKFNEYDEMIKTAIGEDTNKPEDTAGNLGRGKDIQTIVKGLEPEPEAKKGEEDHDRPSVTNLKKMLRKKHRKLNSLEFDSEEEDISDEDFKGSSHESEEEDDEPGESEDSDDYVGKKRRKNLPTRRSTRARTRRYDTHFINDDSDDEPPKRKKKKSIWDETETEDVDTDGSGYGPKEKKKKKKKKKRRGDSDDEPSIKKNRPRIKYGGLTSSEEEELGKGRRTRGKRTTYVDTMGSDSEEETEIKKNPRRLVSDDEDFVANEDDEVEDEDKESDDKEEPAEEEDEDADSEQERREKRSLLVPKIYIKKPLGEKKQRELEAAKVKAANIENETSTIKKPEEKESEGTKDETSVVESELIRDEKEIQIPEESKKTEDLDAAINTNLENKPKLAEAIEVASLRKEINTVESTIKKETEEMEEKIDEISKPKQSNSGLLIPDSIELTKLPPKRGRKPKVVHEPIISNVNALFKNDDENDDLSEPPGISLPFFDDLASNSANSKESSTPDTPKKRRGRGPGKKKTLEESLSSIGTKISPIKAPQPAIEIAAPPQPFSQAQPTPSVITRMLQSKPGITIYPVGRIRPKQFATMRDDDSDESSPRNSPASSPVAVPPMSGPPNQYNISGGPRGPPPMVGPYRPHGPPHPGMNHYPRGPPGFRGPPPPQGILPHPYSHHPSHRSMDPSPSGGGPINLTDSGLPSGGQMAGPGRDSPGRRGSSVSRYTGSQTSPGSRPQMQLPSQQPYPPPPASSNGPPPQQAYPPPASTNASTPQQPYPPRPTSGNNAPPPQQSYHPPPNSSIIPPPHQFYPSSTASNNGSPGQLPYSPRPALSNGSHPPQRSYHAPPNSSAGHPPPQQTFPPPPPTSNNGPPTQVPYPSRPSSNSGPPASPQSYSPRPTSSNNGPPATQPPERYYGNYPPPSSAEEPVSSDEGVPPGASSPYSEQYSGEEPTPVIPPADGNNAKAYDDESGGEFAGLASYFSSQRDDDLES